jgi:hypothetical protein
VPKWEYMAVADRKIVDYTAGSAVGKSSDEQRTEALNKLGEDGWELVSVSEAGGSRTYFFKRPK